jgi:hypothetical protein
MSRNYQRTGQFPDPRQEPLKLVVVTILVAIEVEA